MVKKSTFGKALMMLAIAWFISLIYIGIDSHIVFWSAVGIWMVGFLLWLYGDTGIPRPSPRVLEEMERHRGIRFFERRSQANEARKKEKKQK